MKKCLIIKNELNIGNELLAYLVENPNAQDTLEGIVEWWLFERQIKVQVAMVKEALSDLVTRGLILQKKRSNSRTYYRVNQSKHEEIQALFRQKNDE